MYIYIIPHIHICIARQHKEKASNSAGRYFYVGKNWPIPRASAHECVTAVRVTETNVRERERENG